MAVTLKPRRSSTAGVVPTTAQLADGEFGINTADKAVYIRSGSNIVEIASAAGRELGYAERTSTFTTSSTTPVDVPGLAVSPVVGTRPVQIQWGGNMRAVGGGACILSLSVGGIIVSQVVYSGALFQFMGRTYRASGLTAGSSPVIKVQASVSLGSMDLYGDTGDRPYLLVTNL